MRNFAAHRRLISRYGFTSLVTLYTIAASQKEREMEKEEEDAREKLSIDTLTFAPSELKEEILGLPPQRRSFEL